MGITTAHDFQKALDRSRRAHEAFERFSEEFEKEHPDMRILKHLHTVAKHQTKDAMERISAVNRNSSGGRHS
jgi:hypothetical protein